MNKLREWLATIRNLLIILAVIGIGELLPPLQALERWIAPQRTALTWQAGGIAFLGWFLLMAAVIYRSIKGGTSLTRKEIAEHTGRVKSHLTAPAAVARGWKYKLPKRARGAGFSDEVSIGQFKEAWKQRLWLSDLRWRGMFIMALGAALMTLGIFGVLIVLAAPGLKLVAILVLGYATVQIFRAFLVTAASNK